MATDKTVTLVLDGDVSLDQFSSAVAAFHTMLRDVARLAGTGITWAVDDLVRSSALLAVRAEGDEQLVDRVIADIELAAAALEAGSEPPTSLVAVWKGPKQLAALVESAGVQRLRLETSARDFTIQRHAPVASIPGPKKLSAWGAVKGRIQTLSSRNTLRFTLYDRLDNKAVSCYLREGQQEMVRTAWDKLALVEGRVQRDAESGKPLTVREIMSIIPIEEPGDDWRLAHASSPTTPSEPSAAERLRRIRDDV